MALAPRHSSLASRGAGLPVTSSVTTSLVVPLLLGALLLAQAACGGSNSETPWPLAPSTRELKALAKAPPAPSRDPSLPVLGDTELREPRRTWRLPTDVPEPRDPYGDPYGAAGAPSE